MNRQPDSRWTKVSNGSVATLAASVALALAGCATPALQSTVEVPAQFAAVTAAEQEPEVAWWESFGDPVLSDLVRRAARENRDVKIAANACAPLAPARRSAAHG